jgi:hypothetical protein
MKFISLPNKPYDSMIQDKNIHKHVTLWLINLKFQTYQSWKVPIRPRSKTTGSVLGL